MGDLVASKYQLADGVSQYNEWMENASQMILYTQLVHLNLRWLIQVPRLHQLYRASNEIATFAEMHDHIFLQFSKHLLVPRHIQKFIIFSNLSWGLIRSMMNLALARVFTRTFWRQTIKSWPEQWTTSENPPHGYWMVFLKLKFCQSIWLINSFFWL